MKIELEEITRSEMDYLIDSFGESDGRLINSILCDKPSLNLDNNPIGIYRVYDLADGILILKADGNDSSLYTADHLRDVLTFSIGEELYNQRQV